MSKRVHLINSSRRIPPMYSPSYSMLFPPTWMARYDYHLENGSAEHTDDVAFGGEDEGDSEGDDEGGNWDTREDVQREKG
ncbi:hypothetical protein AYX15_07057 [Cryptococcus neoformans]|nr:hypothetical protein AYX15_07057 [Cryptococcus neoformans var. grubii]